MHKKKAGVVIDDLFADAVEEDLITPTNAKAAVVGQPSRGPTASTSATPAPGPSAQTAAKQVSKKQKLVPEERLSQFNRNLEFLAPRIGRRPALKLPLVRKSTWVQLIQLATTEEQMVKVVDLLPGWKEAGKQFDAKFSDPFVREFYIPLPCFRFFHMCSWTLGRCEELSCPLLALQVFGNYSKYNVPLTLAGARQLMHSLHASPIENAITVSALYNVYNITPVAQDLPSCSMLMAACYRHGLKDSLKIGNAFVPYLEQLLAQALARGPPKAPKDKTGAEFLKMSQLRQWTGEAFEYVEVALSVQNSKLVDSIREWIKQNGYIRKSSIA